LAHEIVRLELQDPKTIDERLSVLDRVIGYVLSSLEEQFIVTKGEDPQSFFATMNEILNAEYFVIPPTMDVTFLTDGLAPHKLSGQKLRDILEFPPKKSGRWLFEQAAARNEDFHLFDCDTGSLIYLAVAELKGYPCYLVEVPEHNFIRWASRKNEINWDPIAKQSLTDIHYRLTTGMPPNTNESDCLPFLKSMTRNQILSYWHALVAVRRTENKQYREAEELFQKGYLLNPKSLHIGNDWASFLSTCPDVAFRNAPKAVSLIKPLVECWPNPEYLNTLAAAYAEARDFKAAVETEQHALDLSKTWTTDKPTLIAGDPAPHSVVVVRYDKRELPYNVSQARLEERRDAYAKGQTYAELAVRKSNAQKTASSR
jgi:tetratricopeptide (TPR) repeat protein